MIINGQKLNTIMGDPLYVMLAAHTDATGRQWPAGTEYRPGDHGYDNVHRREVQRVYIGGELVMFAQEE